VGFFDTAATARFKEEFKDHSEADLNRILQPLPMKGNVPEVLEKSRVSWGKAWMRNTNYK
jgi:hypothetical protein